MSSQLSVKSADAAKRRSGSMTDRRRERIRLDISREAAQLFWRQGVAATSGDQIADAVGLSVRSLWRYFRNKESCAEPIVMHGVEWLMSVFQRWPEHQSLEDHFAVELKRRADQSNARRFVDDLLSVQMVGLGDTEPDIRSTWLMACDRAEHQMVDVVAHRLQSSVDDLEVRLHAAAAVAVVRVINEEISRRLLADQTALVDVADMSRRIAQCVRTATSGAIGDPVDAVRTPSPVSTRSSSCACLCDDILSEGSS